MKKAVLIFLLLTVSSYCFAQSDDLLKIHHTEPLYVDLIRDLGARKGEKEWNAGWSINDEKNFISYSGFVEYEFSPINRLGLEVELPFSFYQTLDQEYSTEVPKHRIEGLKMASQYTFWVSNRYQLSMAVGYMNELKFHSFHTMSIRKDILKGNEYSPFIIVAKKWSKNIHSLLYSGPVWKQDFATGKIHSSIQSNFSMHYVFPGTSHFIGVEFNQELTANGLQTIVRPQAKVKVSSGLYLGMLTGIPVYSYDQGMSFMIRVIYEPKKRSKR